VETQLRNKVVLITGASGGIGSAIARAFAVEGANLVLHRYRNLAGLRRLQKELGQVNSLLVNGDLTREAEVKKMFARSQKHFGGVDTLIANAGSWETADVIPSSLPKHYYSEKVAA